MRSGLKRDKKTTGVKAARSVSRKKDSYFATVLGDIPNERKPWPPNGEAKAFLRLVYRSIPVLKIVKAPPSRCPLPVCP
jgi:hypothetical protein